MPERFPSGGFPNGWYVIRPSTELAPKQVEPVHYFGRDMVLFRTESGEARLADPVCPHLGANLALGRVRGENLVCGMHGFEFGSDGQCVKLAYGTRPPVKARLSLYPVHEIDGFIYTYHSSDGAPPTWKVEPLVWDGWTPLRHQRLEFVGHPQEITENSVDTGHFNAVHYYTASVEEDPVADGEKLTASYRVHRPWFGRRLQRLTFEVRFSILAHGLGYSVIHAKVEHTPISIRYFVNAIPIDGERVHLNIAAAVREIGVPGLSGLVRRIVLLALRHELGQDIPFWGSKHHIERPLLAEGDGPIAIYRRWCRQFYTATSTT
jgi:phenylpropionate dioxygenase-like ring-hydroxylating dioxygenase large terminal subunit